MIRFIIRAAAVIALGIATIFAVIDAARSIGASDLMLTPLSDTWDALMPGTRAALGQWFADTVHPVLNEPVLATLAGWPTFAVFTGLAVLLWLLTLRRSKPAGRFSAR